MQTACASGSRAPIHLITSGGTLTSLETAIRFPIRLVESGPAGGAILAARIAAERGEKRILSFDMGGTTAKICLIENGEPLKARSFEVDRSCAVHEGQRIAGAHSGDRDDRDRRRRRFDRAGRCLERIQVGPHSAGSSPGPACYGLGGERPTVTDADLVLGRIDPERSRAAG